MDHLKRWVADVKEEIITALHHPYLAKYIKQPELDEDKLLLVTALFHDKEWPEREANPCILATMFMQMALDTHEDVHEEEQPLMVRQLTVLAGDYYSGLFYSILAKHSLSSFIPSLSEGIKEVNESKMALYEPSTHPMTAVEEWVRSIETTESALYCRLADRLYATSFRPLLQAVLLWKRLIHIRDVWEQSRLSSMAFLRYQHILFPHVEGELTSEQRQHVTNTLQQLVQQTSERVERVVNERTSLPAYLVERIHEMLRDELSISNMKLAEEG